MKRRVLGESAMTWLSAIISFAMVLGGISVLNGGGSAVAGLGVIVLAAGLWCGNLAATRKARVELTGGEDYRQLAEEYRRLSDMAITAQEHTDLKLGDVSARIDHLRDQMESLTKILKEVE